MPQNLPNIRKRTRKDNNNTKAIPDHTIIQGQILSSSETNFLFGPVYMEVGWPYQEGYPSKRVTLV